MKCSSIAVLALAIPSSTLVVSAFVMVIPNTIIHSTTTTPTTTCSALAAAVATTTATATTTLPMTRFERLQQTYKGPRMDTLDDSQVEFTYQDFATAVANTNYGFARNDVVKGVVVEYDRGGAIVDIGAKASAYLPQQEASLLVMTRDEAGVSGRGRSMDISDLVGLDQELDFEIISDEDENGQLLVSIRRIQYRQAWERVLAAQERDEVLEAQVVAVNRGGAICLVEGLRAFLPGSHLAGQMPTDDIIGQTLPLKFLEVNQETNKLVVSNRRAVVEQQMSDLSRGDIVQGMVKALKPYGAFVEVGGMSGLLHISQISYDRIVDLEQVLQPGMQVKCMIIDHDKVNGRIALSTKTLEPEPGDMLKDPALVFEKAEETAEKYHARMEAERKAREEAARDIVLGLGDSLDDIGGGVNGNSSSNNGESDAEDPLSSVSDNLDSLLSS